ncbi:LytR/AlgR family response regulator transcription factor [Pedobacter sp. P26]|uniref:LytR/AlgR family response regulator transcription factor n=1 Tax=Pedobacter sp. P26 TaxID=3423956 RepID=UPI003D67448C
MKTFSCIIIDDEPIALKLLAGCISKMTYLNLIKTYINTEVALQDIITLENNIDFAFIDVKISGLDRLALATQIAHKVENIVLVSANLQHAIDGYNINAKHFLYKPFDFTSFEKTVNAVIDNIAKENPYIMVKLSCTQIRRIYVDEIIAVEGNGNYINIYTTDAVLTPYYKLVDMEFNLKAFLFIKRVNKSYIISTKYIEKIDGFLISLKNGLNVSVGESYRSNFKKARLNYFENEAK